MKNLFFGFQMTNNHPQHPFDFKSKGCFYLNFHPKVILAKKACKNWGGMPYCRNYGSKRLQTAGAQAGNDAWILGSFSNDIRKKRHPTTPRKGARSDCRLIHEPGNGFLCYHELLISHPLTPSRREGEPNTCPAPSFREGWDGMS